VRRKTQVQEKLLRNFVDEEAELSGDDVGSDEDDDDGIGGQLRCDFLLCSLTR